ncbi:MAG: DUF368 domain-containing protein [Reinekea sp.]|nr:DUF368 domain-containing protein [Reinekea sp.]MDX1475920.1 DUF368 domain-containing protein [Reinekea sp.]
MKKDYLIWILKGAAMGAADAVPGVSGGTIALITGIYERFIAALASFKPSLWQFVKQKDIKGLWQHIDGPFLLCLGIGILVSLFTVLNVMHWLLTIAAPVVWSFFMGIILVSLWQLSSSRVWRMPDILLLLCGLSIAVFFATATATSITVNPLTLVLGGVLAISAMLLPGISGSFMLLLLGLYPVVVEAVHEREFIIVAWVALGCAIGIVSFSRLLHWTLLRWHDRVMSFMLGFVAGALVKVWPWQFDFNWYLPSAFAQVSGNEPYILYSLVATVVGGVLVALLYKRTEK